jgi:hypothetical protein
MNDSAAALAREAKRVGMGPRMAGVARLGLAARAVSWALVGVIAIKVAIDGRGSTEDRTGALRTLADEPLGTLMLLALAAGFAAYALWRLSQALLDREREGDDAVGLAKRAGYLARGVVYGVLCLSTMSVVLGEGGGGSDNKEDRAAGGLLGWPAGRWIVIAAGLAVIGAGLFNGYRAATRKFREKLATEEMSKAPRRLATVLGVGGMLARGIVFTIAGAFLVKAAIDHRPSEAVGLDGALAKLAQQPLGTWLLGLVAAGLLAYGAYGLFETRYREV